MPDEWDKKNLTTLINKWKRQKFTFEDNKGKKHIVSGSEWIKAAVADARIAHEVKSNEFAVKSKDSDMRVSVTMPPLLQQEIIDGGYPTLFKDMKHHEWFYKNFPEFRVASKR
jgi:hypothetical protein